MNTIKPARMFGIILALLFISSLYGAYAIPDSTYYPPPIPVPPPPPCELCNGKVVAWGNIQCSDVPLYGGAYAEI